MEKLKTLKDIEWEYCKKDYDYNLKAEAVKHIHQINKGELKTKKYYFDNLTGGQQFLLREYIKWANSQGVINDMWCEEIEKFAGKKLINASKEKNELERI